MNTFEKIKPQIVDGEAVCSGDNCPSWFYVRTALGEFMCRASRLYLAKYTVCWPYYRIRLKTVLNAVCHLRCGHSNDKSNRCQECTNELMNGD